MKTIILITLVGLLSTNVSQAQIKNAKTETVKIFGNCGMCESTIEKAGSKSKWYKTDWNTATKMASITYDSRKTNIDAVLKSIALSGYDNNKFLAPDDAYAKLPGCCKYERENKAVAKTVATPSTDTKGSMENHAGHNKEEKTMDMQEMNQLQPLFDNYFSLKDALVKTDAPTASAKAAALLVAINTIQMNKMKMDEHMAYMKVVDDLKKDATSISADKKIEAQREAFINLSMNMIGLIKIAKPAEAVYLQHCPMANDGKGADWLSKESVVKNPYYGSMMLSCGKTVETIQQ